MRNTHRTSWPRHRAAFTLIELVAVMGIILMMTLVVVGSYVGITRAIAARAGINHMRNAVLITRQHACMDGQRTYLYILNETEYVICRRAGRVSSGPSLVAGTQQIKDLYADLAEYKSDFNEFNKGLRIYNFSNPTGHTRPYVTVSDLSKNASGGWLLNLEKTSRFSMEPASFQIGDIYGIELYTKRALPRGYTFKEATYPQVVSFEPTGMPVPPAFTIPIVETINPGLVQSVKADSGKIVVETQGTED